MDLTRQLPEIAQRIVQSNHPDKIILFIPMRAAILGRIATWICW